MELMEQFHDLPQGGGMGHRYGAKAVLSRCLLPLQGTEELVHHVVDIAKGQFHRRIAHRNGQVPGDIVAEGGHHAVIVGTAPLTK